MERLLRVASPLGLYAEEFDAAHRAATSGNFPQAFSHLALIEAAGADHPRRAHRRSSHERHYDVIVIGSGAGGGTLVHRLAPSGKRILLLERGDWLPREPQNWSAARRVRRQPLRLARTPGTTSDGKPFQPQVHYFVGGATKLYGAALYRLRAEDFGELRHHDGISPAWPIGYDEFEPYYTQAEQLYQVHGARGEDPTEPPASAPYPHPAVSHEPRIQQLSDDLEAVGLHPFHAPCGVLLDEGDMPDSACVRCATCDGFPCLVHAKSDAEVLGVRPALEHDNVTLLTNARAVRLETERGRHGGHRRGRRARRRAGDVHRPTSSSSPAAPRTRPRCCWPRPTTRTRTGSPTAPTRSGATTCSTTARPCWRSRKEPNPTVFQKTLGLNDFYFGTDDFEFPLGNIQMVGKSSADMYRGEKPLQTKLAPEWTLRRTSPATRSTSGSPPRICRGRRTASRCATTAASAIAYKAEQPGAQGAAAARAEGAARAPRACTSTTSPAPRLPQERDPGRRASPTRPARAASAPTRPTSVLNTDCRAHEVDNLYVVDTSFFPSIGAVNPALTAMANALRVGDHLLERLGAPRPARVAACRADDRRTSSSSAAGSAASAARASWRKHDDVA